jgi:ergothioneine biosynthesis protein EgtB
MARPLRHTEQERLESLRLKFLAAWRRTDEIFRILPDEALLAKPIVWRHPFIFYVGHLPAFSWNQICGAILNWNSYNPYFDDLFCRGVDPDVDTGECHWHPGVPDEWPSLKQTIEYRDRVRSAILDALTVLPLDAAGDDVMTSGGRIFQLVLEHEYMHQETLLYMLQQYPIGDKVKPRSPLGYSLRPAAKRQSIRVPSGRARLGSKFDAIEFGWDNEFGETVIEVPAFRIDSLPVTNGEFMEFIDCGAYDDRQFWREEDWQWKIREQRGHPSCWSRCNGAWIYRAMFDAFPLEQVSSWPVYVSLAEARAYTSWRGMRLPTEAEFHRAAYYGPDGRESIFPWGNASPEKRHGNLGFASWAPTPTGSNPAGASRWGISELVGNGWELTDTPFMPLPGFTPYIASYPDYSADFFDGKHFVLKGASWATDSELLRPSFRNWYQAHYPYVFAKFRCVADAS